MNLDDILEELAAGLVLPPNPVPWISSSYGRAYPFRSTTGVVPKVPKNNITEGYVDVLHDDNQSGNTFFNVNGPRSAIDSMGDFYGYYEVPVSLYATFQVTSGNVFTPIDSFIRQVLDKLRNYNYVTINQVVDNDTRDIFSEFTINEQHRELLMWPKYAFRVDMTIRYEESCFVE